MLHAVIMAGGSGTRLWPESRRHYPKQFLSLTGAESLLAQTVSRLGTLATPENIHIITSHHLAELVRAQFPHYPHEAIIAEPCPRNTAPCVALAAMHCLRKDPEAIMLVLPSDHVISTDLQFQNAIRQAVELVEQDTESLITLGVTPTSPSDAYGYIERGEELISSWDHTCPKNNIPWEKTFHVKRFREKPDQKTACEFLATGRFYWNSGIFVWRAQTILDNFYTFCPQMVPHLKAMNHVALSGSDAIFTESVHKYFPMLESTAVDVAILEKSRHVLVIEAPFSWDDAGSWSALERLHTQDSCGNTILADSTLMINSHGCIIRCPDANRLVATVGIENLVVVVTQDAVLIFNKNQDEAVREVTRKLTEIKREDLL